MNPYFLLDMDGVIADFMGGLFKHHGRTYDRDAYPKGQYSLSAALGMSREEALKGVIGNPFFWTDLELYPWAKHLMNSLVTLGQVYIASTPLLECPQSAAAKLIWLEKHFDFPQNKVMLGAQKHLLARENAILIDDHQDHVEKFRDEGGYAILFPQPWNSLHGDMPDQALKSVLDKAELYVNKIKKIGMPRGE